MLQCADGYFTLWDRFEVQGPKKMKELIQWIKVSRIVHTFFFPKIFDLKNRKQSSSQIFLINSIHLCSPKKLNFENEAFQNLCYIVSGNFYGSCLLKSV